MELVNKNMDTHHIRTNIKLTKYGLPSTWLNDTSYKYIVNQSNIFHLQNYIWKPGCKQNITN